MEPKNKPHDETTEPGRLDSPTLSDIPKQFADLSLTWTLKEAKARLDVYAKLNDIQLQSQRAQHQLELERQAKLHQQRMDVLKFVVPVFSGLVFAGVGLALIYNANPTIQYMGVSLLFIGACALIPGIPKVLTNILEAVKGLNALAVAAQKVVSETAKAERKEE